MNAQAENTPIDLQTPEVRDLAWACFSPALLDSAQLGAGDIHNCALGLTEERQAWLQALDRAPQALLDYLAASPSARLGIYFEHLWHFFLREDSAVELLAHNLPVRDGTSTLGEFDCIYYCHQRQRPVHLELAVKFYLYHTGAADTPGSAQSAWLGPNARDRLDLKMQRMLQHQIRLSAHPAGAQALGALGVRNPVREIQVKGRLYRHASESAQLPPAYNRRLPLHDWCRAQELPALAAACDQRYAPLRREQWLAPVMGQDTMSPGQLEQLAQQCQDRPVQLAVIDDQGGECRRLFLVPQRWPDAP